MKLCIRIQNIPTHVKGAARQNFTIVGDPSILLSSNACSAVTHLGT